MIATDTVVLEPGYYHAGAVYQVVAGASGRLTVRRGGRTVAIVTAAGLEWRASAPLTRAQVTRIAADPEAARRGYASGHGRCWRCGRRLTHPESIAAGVGPECGTAVAPPPQGSLL